jgi:HD domain-containing protein
VRRRRRALAISATPTLRGSTAVEDSRPTVRRIRNVLIVDDDRLYADRSAWPGPNEVPQVTIALVDVERESFDPAVIDRKVRAPTLPFDLLLHAAGARHPERAAAQVLIRCQSLIGERNDASTSEIFDRVLAFHREMHDLDKPLVEAAYWHALDTWQWTLRLEPRADLVVQLAALFHDVERLVSGDSHARRGATIVVRALADHGLPIGTGSEVAHLIANHERTSDDARSGLLADADALSFFSLDSPGSIDYFGATHTLRRLRPRNRSRLAEIRLRADVRAIVDGVLAEQGWAR